MTLFGILVLLYLTNMIWAGFVVLLNYKFPKYISEYLTSALSNAGHKVDGKMRYWGGKTQEKMGKAAKRMSEKAKSKIKRRNRGQSDE